MNQKEYEKRRKKLEKLVWKHTHKDYRGSVKDHKSILINGSLIGEVGTILVPLVSLTDQQLLNQLPASIREDFNASQNQE